MKAYKIDLSGFTGKVREVVSEAVQRNAFALGWGWKRDPTPISISHTECPVLYLESDGVILKDDGISNWSHDPNTAITAADFLAIETAKEPEFKPFDRVLTRDGDYDTWACDLFSHKDDEHPYVCVGAYWEQCIPYEGNEHLIGTTDSPE